MCDTCTQLTTAAAVTALTAEVVALEAAAGWSVPDAVRPLLPHEITATVRFGDLDRIGEHAANTIARVAAGLHDTSLTALLTALRRLSETGDAVRLLDALQQYATAVGGQTLPLRQALADTAAEITAALTAAHEAAAAQVVGEARRQGVPDRLLPLAGDLPASREDQRALSVYARQVAEAVPARVLDVALREARAGFSTRLHPASIVAAVQTSVAGASQATVVDLARQAATHAVNTGRAAAAAATPEPEEVYASELMDRNTCVPCSHVDGRRYTSLDDALVDYPAGGTYTGCLGGARCRGTLVFVWAREEAPSLDQSPGDRGIPIDRTPLGPSRPVDGGQGELPLLG